MQGIYQLEQLQQEILLHPERWRPLVLTNGCFDLLHVGHVRYLQTAKTLGKALIVGLNSDASVGQLKPQQANFPPRPLIPESQRAEVLSALKAVDGVIIFPQLTATHLIATLKPDIYVKGGDYTPETLPEYPDAIAHGVRIELIKVEVGASTTAIIEGILQGSSNE